MPSQASNQTSIRAPGHKSELYFAYFTPDVVWQATVLIAPVEGWTFLGVSTASGSESDVERGYLVRIETPGGVLKGITNVSAGGTITATNLPIHEYAPADIDIDSGDVVKIYNIPYLADKLPIASFTFAPDDIPYSTQGTAFAPNCRSGGHFMGFVDGYKTAAPSTFATVPMAGSLSENLDPDSGSSGMHLWELLTNTLAFAAGSSDSDANPVIEASVGYGIAKHTYTDSSNSASWSQFVCFQVYDANTLPRRILEATLNGDEQTGWSADIELFSNTSISLLPDGSLVGLFVREHMGGAVQSLGSSISGRSHIKLVGFLHRDENEITPQSGKVKLGIQSPLQRLASLPGFSKIYTRTSSDWTQIEDLTVLLGDMHLTHYYSFFSEMFDVIIDSAFLDKLYSAFYINKQVAVEQMRELADGVDARLTALRTGELCLHTHPSLIPEGDRSGVTTTYTIGKRDLQRMNFTRDHWKVVETLESRGFIAGASDNTPLFSRYPGNTPGRGSQTIAVERQISDDQDDCNERCGRRGAKADGTYINSSGEYMRAVEWSPVLFGSHDFFDFNKEYVLTDLDETSNLRGVDLSTMRYYLSRISVRYHDGTADVEPVFLTATNAPPGSTYVPADIPLPDYTPIDVTPAPLPPPTSTIRIPNYSSDTLPTKLFTLDRGGAHASIATAWSPSLSSLTYTDISTGLSGIGVWACSDPYDYRRRFALTADGLYRCDNIWSFSTWTQVADNATLYGDAARIGTFVGMSINRKGYIYITSGTNAFIYSTDYGATWNRVSVDGGTLSYYTSLPSGNEQHMVAGISSHNSGASGVLYATTGTMYFGVGNTFRLRKSTDWGATWNEIADRDDFGFPNNMTNPCNLHIPYIRSDGSPNVNDSSQELYLLQDTPNSGYYLARSTNAGLSGSVVSHPGAATSHTGWQMMSFTHDGAKIAFAQRAHGLGTSAGIIISDDSGATEIRHSHLFSQGDNYICLNGFSNHSQAWIMWCQVSANGGDAKIIWTVDDGANYQSVATPSTFSGAIKLAAYVEWDLSDFIAPAA